MKCHERSRDRNRHGSFYEKGASNKGDRYLKDKQARESEKKKYSELTNMLPDCSLCYPICSSALGLTPII